MLRKSEGKRRREWHMARRSQSVSNSVDVNLSKPRETGTEGPWRAVGHGAAKSGTQLSD